MRAFLDYSMPGNFSIGGKIAVVSISLIIMLLGRGLNLCCKKTFQAFTTVTALLWINDRVERHGNVPQFGFCL